MSCDPFHSTLAPLSKLEPYKDKTIDEAPATAVEGAIANNDGTIGGGAPPPPVPPPPHPDNTRLTNITRLPNGILSSLVIGRNFLSPQTDTATAWEPIMYSKNCVGEYSQRWS
jgi:hypothetical protein